MKPWDDDDFATGATAYGDQPNRYLRMRPFGTATTFTGAGVSGFGPINGWDGHIFDGHGGASFHIGPGLLNEDVTGHVVERSIYQADGQVSIKPRFRVEAGTPNLDSFRGVFLWARVSGGSIATTGGNPQYTEFHNLPDGIFFAQVKITFNPERLVLGYCSGGVVTIVGNAPLADFVSGNAVETPSVRQMRMVVVGNTVTCFRSFDSDAGPSLIGQSTGATSEVQIFNFTSVSFPSAAGRWGMGGQVFKDQSNGCRCGIRINELAIRDSAGDLVFRDRFNRALKRAAAGITDQIGTNGFSLMQAWTGDSAGALAGFPHAGHMEAFPDSVTVGPDISTQYSTSGQNYGWMVWQIPANSPQQHRSAAFTMDGTVGIDREAGIWLRGSFTPATPFLIPDLRSEDTPGAASELDYRKSGYLALIRWDGTEFSGRVDAYFPSSSLAYQAVTIATLDLSTAGLALGTEFTLDMEARNFDANPFGQGGVPSIRVKLNSTVLEPTANAVGVSVQDDWIRDLRSNAVLEGATTGLFFQTDTFGSALCQMTDWQNEDLSDPPVDQDTGQASIVLEGETDGIEGVLNIPVSWGIVELPRSFPRRHAYESGHLQSSPTMHRLRRRWSVAMRGATAADREEATAFFESHAGIETPFTWSLPVTNEQIPARFVEDSFEWTRISSAENAEGLENYGTFQVEELFVPSLLGGSA